MATGRIKQFLGSFASDALADVFVATEGWCVGDMIGMIARDHSPGLSYYNTTTGTTRVWDGFSWEDFGAFWGIFTVINGDLAAQVAAVGTDERTFIIHQDEPVSADLTIPANITLWFVRGGSCTITAPAVLRVAGAVTAPLRQIFSGAAGSVLFTGSTAEVQVEWFGAAVNDTDDDSAAWAFALAALVTSGGTCLLGAGTSRINTSITLPTQVVIRGVNPVTSRIKYYGNDAAVINAGNITNCGMANLAILCTVNAATVAAMHFTGAFRHLCKFDNLRLTGSGGAGGLGTAIWLTGGNWDGSFDALYCGTWAYAIRLDDDGGLAATNNHFSRIKLQGITNTFILIDHGSSNSFFEFDAESSTCSNAAVHVIGDGIAEQGKSNVFVGCRFGDNPGVVTQARLTACQGNIFLGCVWNNNVGGGLCQHVFEALAEHNMFIGDRTDNISTPHLVFADPTARFNVVIGNQRQANQPFGWAARNATLDVTALAALAKYPDTSADGDATPDVMGVGVLRLPSNTGPLAITGLDAAAPGQTVTLICDALVNAPTIADGGNFKLSAAWAPNADDTLTLFYDGTFWIELCRSAN